MTQSKSNPTKFNNNYKISFSTEVKDNSEENAD